MLALGSLLASNDGMDVGFLTNMGNAAMIPELIVTTKKPCYLYIELESKAGSRESRYLLQLGR